ncbi:hypothetical protein TCAL_12512 [Tigriopus californicus]|uniref:adenosine deaminase n=1 Tax=Tigriopus californicus TaxID=6832 RepID=A0A553PHI5_TIGCA|nr:adenosine deaminase-like [Tigriopus californicus]TRY77146.1 hypothetical protein TCAL_12512 [Tigriopus californicus]|eukprot:TCALIF_12512-PA protein Name:"Similar to add Adenosine deaminase (Enterococcus faecalis (strain ATCC 700802 / V583))" AED:0.03 eAED:0.03 QI:53/1/0.8/1/0.75/0.6/5/18/385
MLRLGQEQKLELIKQLPKTELHLHLDGSLSPEFMERESRRSGIRLPVPAADIPQWIMEQKCDATKQNVDNVQTKGGNWSVFDFCNQFLQTKIAIQEAVQDLLNRLYANHTVVYAEIRFAPVFSTLKGLTAREAVEAALAGFNAQDKVRGGLIICLMRSFDETHGLEMVELAKSFWGRNPFGVVGIDVAGDEGSFPLASESDAMFKGVMKAKDYGIPITIHAGEWPDNKFKTIKNIEFAINTLGADRIGHGIALGRHPDVLKLLKDTGTAVEVCLTSNVGRGFKVKSFADHPAKVFAQEKIPFALSCDNLLLSGDLSIRPNPCGEIMHLLDDVLDGDELERWSIIRRCLLHGLERGFNPSCPPGFKEWCTKKIDELFKQFQIPATN